MSSLTRVDRKNKRSKARSKPPLPVPPVVHVASFHWPELRQLPPPPLHAASPAPSGPGLRSAPLGSWLPRSLCLRLFPEPQAPSCGDAPRAGCRCRTGRRLRDRPSGAPLLVEGRLEASGTDREWRGARRPLQVRKGRGSGRVGTAELGAAHVGRPISLPPWGPRLRSRSFSTPFRNVLVPVSLPFSDQPGWQSGSFRRTSLASVCVCVPPRFAPRSPPAPAFGSARDPTSVPPRLASPPAPAGVFLVVRRPLSEPHFAAPRPPRPAAVPSILQTRRDGVQPELGGFEGAS